MKILNENKFDIYVSLLVFVLFLFFYFLFIFFFCNFSHSFLHKLSVSVFFHLEFQVVLVTRTNMFLISQLQMVVYLILPGFMFFFLVFFFCFFKLNFSVSLFLLLFFCLFGCMFSCCLFGASVGFLFFSLVRY